MSKKHKAKLKEIERLRALYNDTQSQTPSVSDAPTATTVNQSTPSASIASADDHSHIKRDLTGLIILIVVMLAILIGFYWLVENTGFGSWLIGLFNA